MSTEVVKTQDCELHQRGLWRASLKESFVSCPRLGEGTGSREDSTIEVCCNNTEGNCTGARGGAYAKQQSPDEREVGGWIDYWDGVG